MLADVVGYYGDADGRYYTKPQIDAALGAKADKPTGTTALFVDYAEFWNQAPDSSNFAIVHDPNNGFLGAISNPLATVGSVAGRRSGRTTRSNA